jgi:hypothetical protein
MFHFPATPPTSLYIQPAATSHQTGWVTPFGNPGIKVQLATPPGISQPHTSFIGHPAPRHPPCALHNLTNTVKSDRNKDTHAHYTNLKQHIDHTRHTTFIAITGCQGSPRVRSMTRLRDVLSQNPNRVRDPQAPAPIQRSETETVGLKDGFTNLSPCNVQSTHHLKHLVHTHPQESRQPHGCQASPPKGTGADG